MGSLIQGVWKFIRRNASLLGKVAAVASFMMTVAGVIVLWLMYLDLATALAMEAQQNRDLSNEIDTKARRNRARVFALIGTQLFEGGPFVQRD